MNSLGDHIRSRRLDLGLLQAEVAEQIGVNPLTVTNWELNASSPAVHYLPKIIRFLGYNPMPSGTSMLERLIAFRKSNGWTQEQMAHHLGIDPSTLQGWESGQQKPSPKKLEQIAPVFAIRIGASDLMDAE